MKKASPWETLACVRWEVNSKVLEKLLGRWGANEVRWTQKDRATITAKTNTSRPVEIQTDARRISAEGRNEPQPQGPVTEE